MTMDIQSNHEDIRTRLRDAKWLMETYQSIKRRGHKTYNNWKTSGRRSSMSSSYNPSTFVVVTSSCLICHHSITLPLPTLRQHNGDLTTLGGTTDWCINYCDGCIWLMYMAFVFKVLNMQNLGRDFPGERFTADLGVPMTEENMTALRQEYKRKLVEDGVRKKSERRTKAQKSDQVLSSTASPHVFDYGDMMESEKKFRFDSLPVSATSSYLSTTIFYTG
jgi:hypothetical protein